MPFRSKLVYDVNEASGNRIWDGITFLNRAVFHKTRAATGWAALLHSLDGVTWTETEITNLVGPSPTSPVDTIAIQHLTTKKLLVAESPASGAAARAAWTEDLAAFTIEVIAAGNVGVEPDLGFAEYPEESTAFPDEISVLRLNLDGSAPIVNIWHSFRNALGWGALDETFLNVATTAVAHGKIPASFPPPDFIDAPYYDASSRLRYMDTNSVPPIATDVWNPASGTLNYLRWWESQFRLLMWERTAQRMRAYDPVTGTVPPPQIWAGQILGQVADLLIDGSVLWFLTLDDGGVTGTNIRLYKALNITDPPALQATIVQANTLVFSTRLAKLGRKFYVSSFVSGTNRVRIHELAPLLGGGLRRRRG